MKKMEEYNRDSLRRLRKEAMEQQIAVQNKKGSRFVSMLIILMFVLAGGFYIKITDPVWLTGNPSYVALRETLQEWTAAVISAFEREEPKDEEQANDVQETVNTALAENDAV